MLNANLMQKERKIKSSQSPLISKRMTARKTMGERFQQSFDTAKPGRNLPEILNKKQGKSIFTIYQNGFGKLFKNSRSKVTLSRGSIRKTFSTENQGNNSFMDLLNRRYGVAVTVQKLGRKDQKLWWRRGVNPLQSQRMSEICKSQL
eukprot:TRINITY_DN120227_c0_g1_i1.p3 TRINITY_DN120227_c0_g1~~TRINITY_DN120227_c0_g1_i1.p3  ORF type:complete len:147 (+),score=9.33 TRINITY_DN120227_c0_g1_i1:792-1232(+)